MKAVNCLAISFPCVACKAKRDLSLCVVSAPLIQLQATSQRCARVADLSYSTSSIVIHVQDAAK